MSKTKIIVIVGPTSSGKSATAVKIARQFNGEIISADSRQVYKGLDIGSGKITKHEMAGIHHYMLDVASPKKTYSVSQFKRDAEICLRQIYSKNKIPIIVGGTGLYIDTLLGKINIPEVKPNSALRKKLERLSTERLFAILLKLDPRRASQIDPHNPRRLIRAIEIARSIGKVPLSTSLRVSQFDVMWIGLKVSENLLRKRIRARLLSRLRRGMVAEVKKLHTSGLSWKRLENFGLEYRFVSQFLQGKISKQEMIQKIETESWRYSRRQMTWFKRNKDTIWLSPSKNQQVYKIVRSFLKE